MGVILRWWRRALLEHRIRQVRKLEAIEVRLMGRDPESARRITERVIERLNREAGVDE